MKLTEKLELAHWMREALAPVIRTKGEHQAAGVSGPAHWRLETQELIVIYAEGALLRPDDRSLSSVLDIWTKPGKKVVSLSWENDRPWQPVGIVRMATGPWLQSLRNLASPRA
jgi:hypothetical protein